MSPIIFGLMFGTIIGFAYINFRMISLSRCSIRREWFLLSILVAIDSEDEDGLERAQVAMAAELYRQKWLAWWELPPPVGEPWPGQDFPRIVVE